MTNIKICVPLLQPKVSQRRGLIEHSRAAGEFVGKTLAERIARLDQQSFRKPSPEFESESVVPCLSGVVYQERTAALTRIHCQLIYREQTESRATRKAEASLAERSSSILESGARQAVCE